MRIVLFVPHVLVVLDLALVIQRQRHQRIDNFGEMYELGRVRLLELEDQTVWLGLYDFSLEGL